MQTWEQNQVVITQHSKIITGLEISKRQQKLQVKFFDFVTIFALIIVLTKQTQDGGMHDSTKLSRRELPVKAAYNTLTDTPDDIADS